MSLTQAAEVFAGIHEDALNDLLQAFCTARPRYLHYGSSSFVPATTFAETTMPPIAFPGVPGGIQWRVRLTVPHIDLFRQDDPLPAGLPALVDGQFSIRLGVELCLACRRLRVDPRPPRPDTGRDDRRQNEPPRDDRRPNVDPTCCRLEVFGIGHLEHVMTSTGEHGIALAVDRLEIVDIAPTAVEAVIECLLFMIIQAVLADIRLPLRALRAGAFSLAVTDGPLIEDDQIKARGMF